MVPRSNNSQRLLGRRRRRLGPFGEILDPRVSSRHSRRVLFADSMGPSIRALEEPLARSKAADLSNYSGRGDRSYLDMGDLLLRFNAAPPPDSDAQYRTGKLCFPRFGLRTACRLCDHRDRFPDAKFFRGNLPRFPACFRGTRRLPWSIWPVPARGSQMGWRMVVLFPGRSGGEDDASLSCPRSARAAIALAQAERGRPGWVLICRLGHCGHPGRGDVRKPEYRRAPHLTHLSPDGDSCLICLQPE